MGLDILYLSHNRRRFTHVTLSWLLEHTNWDLVDRFVWYDDRSKDGTADLMGIYASSIWDDCEFVTRQGRFGGPVRVMLDYLARDPADNFVKIDNDIMVPPGWLDVLLDVQRRYSWVELLGMSAGMTHVRPELDDQQRSLVQCAHIGGVGLMRSEAFIERPSMVPNGRFGFTQWQQEHEVKRAWVTPDVRCFELDRIPFDPWRSLSHEYVLRRWQRDWGPYADDDTHLWDWWTTEDQA